MDDTNEKQQYKEMTKEELIKECENKDVIINKYNKCNNDILTKDDIMILYKCEKGKALKILKLFFQMGFGNKIGKEYYISKQSHNEFLKCYAGKEVFI